MPVNFHTPRCENADADYRVSAANVQNCELLGLADLNTGAEDVRSRIATYLIDLVRIGVRGFRVDAAKHISPHDLDAILALVATSVGPGNVPYYFLEVIDGGGEAIHASDFLDLGRASGATVDIDRKSTRLNFSHVKSSYAVFCLKKRKKKPGGRVSTEERRCRLGQKVGKRGW